MRLKLLCLILGFSCNISEACSVLPKEIFRPPLEIVQNADSIMLLELESANSSAKGINYTFRVVENLFGVDRLEYELFISKNLPGYTAVTPSHTNYEFWTHSHGSSSITSYCTVRPSFQIHHQYLVIDIKGASGIAFEKIHGPEDRWLKFVKHQINEYGVKESILTSEELIKQFSSIHIYECLNPSRANEDSPSIIETIRGVPPQHPLNPNSIFNGFSCLQEEKFAYLYSSAERPFLLVPIRSGYMDFSYYARGIELVPGNRISLNEL